MNEDKKVEYALARRLKETELPSGAPFPPKPCDHLPFEPRMALVRASQVSTDGDPLARVRAIQKASEFAKARYPTYFR